MKTKKRSAGFTLIEILIAVSLLSVVSLLSYRGLVQALETKDRLDQERMFWQKLSLTFSRIEDDLRQAQPRPIRNNYGQTDPAFMGKTQSSFFYTRPLEFTRGGLLFTTENRSDLQRVGYELKNGTLNRVSWSHLDRGPYVEPDSTLLLDKVDQFRVRFYKPDGQLSTRWPISPQMDILPRGVEIQLILKGRGEFVRTFVVGGST